MAYRGKERRRYERFDMETRVDYQLVTKVKFRVLDKQEARASAEKCSGISRNISAEGMRFISDKKLRKGDRLKLEVFLPGSRKPIPMSAEVMWSKEIFPYEEGGLKFDTGVRLLRVRSRSVAKSIHIDRKYKEPWSIVLDSILGGFHRSLHKAMVRKRKFSSEALR